MDSERTFSSIHASVYDLLYHDKPYEDEVDMVLGLAGKMLGTKPKRMIDLACGTGRHLALFADRGLYVHGNDISEGMIATANQRMAGLSGRNFHLSCFPMQNLDVGGKDRGSFDLATAFYTAMGYLIDPDDLNRFLRNVKSLLRPGGVFFADLWNGYKISRCFEPRRERVVEGSGLRVKRVSEVRHDPGRNLLSVDYDFEVMCSDGRQPSSFHEKHQVRYHTAIEIKSLLLAHGYRNIMTGPFFDEASVVEDAWNFYVIAQA